MPDMTYSSIEMIKKLISFDTTSRESNLDLIQFIENYLASHGIKSDIISDATGNKANLYAIVGPECDGGIVLSGHTDVVPVDGQTWNSNPFEVLETPEKLYGRGTSDMKSFIGIALANVPNMLQSNLKIPIHLCFSYDEEVGCLGIHGLVPKLLATKTKPAACIVGEPTEMKVVNAHKGVRVVRTRLRGLEAHSSATHVGVNAVMFASELITFLNDIAEEMRKRSDPDSRFEPPYTTLSVGTIEGGTAVNIIPKDCEFHWEHRVIPGTDEDEILNRFRDYALNRVLRKMRKVFPDSNIEIEELATVKPLVPQDNSPAETLVLALTHSNQTYAVSYGTEGGILQTDAEVPTVVCGPGSIAEAHKPNEFIALSEIKACETFVTRLINYCASR